MIQELAAVKVSELAAIELMGVIILSLGIVWVLSRVAKEYSSDWPLGTRIYFWVICTLAFGPFALLGIRAFLA